MRRILAALIISTGFVSADALACVCNPGEMENPLEKAEVAFVGRPVKIEALPLKQPPPTVWQRIKSSISQALGSSPGAPVVTAPEFLGSVRVTFEVSEYLKGDGPKQFQVMTGYGDADCGLAVSISKRYSIYARRSNGALRTSYCFGSAEFVRQQRQAPCPDGS